jgi:RHS repeat-associated protein
VFSSNSSAISVQFNNTYVIHWQGKLLEEFHYYPFGLCFDVNTATSAPRGSVKYNSQYLEQDEFTDAAGAPYGLDWYDFDARSYDPQIGRWLQGDPLSQYASPFMAMGNNPASITDPSGLWGEDGGDGPDPFTWLYVHLRSLIKYGEWDRIEARTHLEEKSSQSPGQNSQQCPETVSSSSNNDAEDRMRQMLINLFITDNVRIFSPTPVATQDVSNRNVIIFVQRYWETDQSTISSFHSSDNSISGYVLEPPGPSTTVSGINKRVPAGSYDLVLHNGTHFKNVYKLYNDLVPQSRAILIHSGNYPRDTHGCQLVGSTRGINFVGGSRETLERVNNFIERNQQNIKYMIFEPINILTHEF